MPPDARIAPVRFEPPNRTWKSNPLRRAFAVFAAIAASALALVVSPKTPDVPECPPNLACHFVPAAYAQTNPRDPDSYGNYDPAARPGDGNAIKYIVIHDTEEDYDTAIGRFRDPRKGASANYVIRSSDGDVTQLVHDKDIAYHAGNYWFNAHSIGIEHEGVLVDGARWYTEAMYRSSARLVRYLAARYHIPLDREHILGHEELPSTAPGRLSGMHTDPGPYWDWDHYFDLLGAPLRADPPHPADAPLPSVVTIAPPFHGNTQPLQQCVRRRCVELPPQGSSIIYLHTAPAPDAPLVGDTVIHPDGSPGTTRIDDWSAKASAGQSFVVADRSGDWTAIWFGGRLAWFHDRDNLGDRVGVPGNGLGVLLTPRPGLATVPIYGAAYPEPAAYPHAIPPNGLAPLPYTIPAGQVYLGSHPCPGTYYYARFDGTHAPDNHTLITGDRHFWQISFNHRRVFVDANDVVALPDKPAPPAVNLDHEPPNIGRD
jgi:N-acetylmuramoyl-L-alanine amidase-like protein